MNADTWLALSTALAVILSIILQKWDARHVRKRLEASGVKRDAKLDEIHRLVNGRMGAELKLTLVQAQRIAALTRDPKDIALANEAERAYQDHQARMVRVDIAASKQVDNPS